MRRAFDWLCCLLFIVVVCAFVVAFRDFLASGGAQTFLNPP
jgi:hypothetical protein